ncbi:mechanosensitive ion channel family protein [Micromonospora sp. NPDC049645]|uniref:mechanosensitive ion channel family protein n=1 Tax=Micromonospora sp. NPDC049645 TaxID=3155508 RepID=UPI00342E221B
MRTALIVLATLATAVLVDVVAGVLIRRAARGRYRWLLEPLRDACRRPAAAVLLAGALHYALPPGPADWQRHLRHANLLVLIAASAWLLIRTLSVVETVSFSKLPSDLVTSRRIRRARTQIRPVRRLTVAVVTIVAIGLILITFRPVRLFGISVLTSAGVVGALIGLSARTALGNAFAGVQVAFADGLHVGDVLDGGLPACWSRSTGQRSITAAAMSVNAERVSLPRDRGSTGSGRASTGS